MAKRLGIVQQAYLSPLFHALRVARTNIAQAASGAGTPFPIDLTEDLPGSLVIKLRQGDLDAAFLSPIDYAREKATFRLIPQLAVVSAGESNAIQLIFREHLRQVTRIAITPTAFSAEIVLAHIVLAEKYEIHPQFVPLIGTAEEALSRADAVLVTGNDILANPAPAAPRLDLVDEWTDIAELPFVHGLWMSTEGALTPEELKAFIKYSEQGAQAYRAPDPDYEEHLAEHFAYSLHEDALNGLTEFLNMAFYHGILKEIADPKFLSLAKGRKQA